MIRKFVWTLIAVALFISGTALVHAAAVTAHTQCRVSPYSDLGNVQASYGVQFAGTNRQMLDADVGSGNLQAVGSQLLVDAALRALRERAGNTYDGEGEITPLSSVRDLAVPAGALQIVAQVPYGIHPGIPTPVNVNVFVDNKLVAKLNLRFSIHSFQNVLVVARPVIANSILLAEDVRYERLDSSHLNTGFLTDSAKVIGQMVRRPLMPGTVINEFMLAKPLVVKRGALVTIVAKVGNMEVTAEGQAMQDGHPGEVIRVQNSNSLRVIAAQVLDSSTVMVRF